jgi:hypothetical protein
MIQVLRNHGSFAYGQESDVEKVAEEWADNDFSPAQADAWLEAGCFRADDARMLADHDITPEQARQDVDDGAGSYRESIGYKFANSDLDIEDVLRLIEEVA